MEKPIISSDFTIDDIHKIREYHYELTKNMTPEERSKFYKEGADIVEAKINERRKSKLKASNE